MDTKINPPNPRREKKESYPWLRLLDLEIQKESQSVQPRGRGRPRGMFPRKSMHTTLTEEELAALDALVELLSERMGGAIHRGNLIAFMTLWLSDRLSDADGTLELPAEVNSFSELSDFLICAVK